MDGLEVVQRLQNASDLARFVAHGEARWRDRVKGPNVGADDYLPKTLLNWKQSTDACFMPLPDAALGRFFS